MESFQQTRLGRQDQPFKPLAVRTLAEQQAELPDWRLDHLSRMTDSTGMLQHATFTIPNFAEGYCTDDNARALLLTVLLEELGQDGPEVERLATRYAAFLQAAFDRETRAVPQLPGLRPPLAGRGRVGRLARPGALGAGHLRRPVAAAATCRPGPRRTSSRRCRRSLETTSPRAWAFGLLGIHEYLRRFGGDRLADAGPRHARRPG